MTSRIPVTLCLVASLAAAGCSTRLNPYNWFGQARSVPVSAEAAGATQATNPLIPQRRAVSFFRRNEETAYLGRPIAQVASLEIERRPGGAVILATGIAPTPGRYEARLSPIEIDDTAKLVYSLDARLAAGPASMTPEARSVKVAVYLTDQQLAGIREIEVRGAGNALVTRR